MNKAFEKLMAKKKASGDKMPEHRQEARSSVLDDLMHNMDDRHSKKLGGLKKVSVMAPSQEGLQKGLDLAKHVVGDSEASIQHEDHMSQGGMAKQSDEIDPEDNHADEQEEAAEEPTVEDEDRGTEDDLASHEEHDERTREELQAEIDELKARLSKSGR